VWAFFSSSSLTRSAVLVLNHPKSAIRSGGILDRVQLTPREQEKLFIYVAADIARRRKARGLKLNLPESIALITEAMLEGARDGRSAADVMSLGRQVLTRDDVMEEVPDMLHVVQVEATFPDGTKLVSCHDPIP
jgi:urease subunit gamma